MPSLGRLQRIVQDISAAASLDEILRITATQVKEVMAGDVCSIYLMDSHSQELVLMCTDGLDPASVGRVRMPLGDGLVGLVGDREQVLNIEDAPQHPNFHYFPETHEEAYHAFLGAPIVHYRELVGVLVVQQREARRFDGEDEAFMVTIAAHLAGTLNHAINSGKVSNLLKSKKKTNSFVNGIVGSTGVGIGRVVSAGGTLSFRSVEEVCALDRDAELAHFERALEGVREELDDGYQQMAGSPGDVQAIFDAYRLILEAEDLQRGVRERIAGGLVAPAALKQVIEEHAAIFEAMEDPYFRARGEDIRNIGLRILKFLVEPDAQPVSYDHPCILVGDVVGVSDIAQIPRERLAGIVCMQGSALSHTAILASALGVPAVMGVGELPLRMLSGKQAIIDGHQGRVHFQPSSALLAEFIRLARQESEFDRSLDKLKEEPARTTDGFTTALYVNTGLLSDISPGLQRGAEGVGLYRTEIPFMVHESFPTEDEQYRIYRKVLQEFHPRPVTMRTLDIGGDKPLPYFPVKEDNPYLGWRGIRFTLDHPEIYLGQLRAMLRANEGLSNLKILLPMVSSIDEVDSFLRLLERAMTGLQEDGVEVDKPPVGIMVEVPSTMFMLDFLAWRLDFISIGTNDLTQYLLAVDRNNNKVARLFSRFHPAVIRALHYIMEQSRHHGLSVCLCGELAADPAAVLLLLGMGVDALSMNAYSLPRVKHVIRSFSRSQAEGLVQNALRMHSEGEIRAMLIHALESQGLDHLTRAGTRPSVGGRQIERRRRPRD
ncbi:phosphoenolpyruvate--protein phosphotransferase [Motiliproteus sp. SC1-56]|uniref:phosphoenolpyruvate--protein phosphotransferase n=1 Tax=Motiliproteus sp. SC1-56 TaxID=2799565 RepID=UPI001A9009C7|nr:phosphoenolpyruvate--protein phosphotransferase [Motiliproteus sp. SC1-56]